jgi:hypothetical protein
MVKRTTGSPEGSFGSLVAGEPIYSGLTDWAWDATVAWQDVVQRQYVNAHPGLYVDTATGMSVPFAYRQREYTTAYELTRSFGWDTKHDFTLAAGMDRALYRTEFAARDPKAIQTVADFVKGNVPVSDTRVGPSLQYHSYTKRYVRVIDFETLALQEDYGLGQNIILRAYPSFRALGSSRDVLDLYAAAQYTFALRDGLFRASFLSDTQPEVDRIADASISPAAHLVTPTISGLGRLVADGTLLYRWRNYLNQTSFVGGGDRARGYPTNFFVGRDYVASYSLELRSQPIDILTCQIAQVVFFDAGEAFRGIGNVQPFQSVGFGFRALFPWLDREVFRFDVGFPLTRSIDPATGAPIAPYAFIVSFGQAFEVPTINPIPVLPTGQ